MLLSYLVSLDIFYFESMPTIGSIEPYDGVENFKQYMQRVNFYFTANNVGSEFASTDVTKRDLALAQRKAVLLTVIGKKTFHILTNLLDPKTTEEVTYTDICLKLENYFVPAVLEVAESFRFIGVFNAKVNLLFHMCRDYAKRVVTVTMVHFWNALYAINLFPGCLILRRK